MRTATFLLVILILMANLTACRTTKPQTAEQRTDVQIHTRYVERLVTDTVLLTIPAQTASNVTPTDSSWLETDFAASGAWVDTLGLLHHTLYNKTQQRPTPILHTEVYEDSVRLEYRCLRQRVEVAKPYPRNVVWAVQAFPWLLLTVTGLLAWIFRHPLAKIIRAVLCR